jgi:hypothetical protein
MVVRVWIYYLVLGGGGGDGGRNIPRPRNVSKYLISVTRYLMTRVHSAILSASGNVVVTILTDKPPILDTDDDDDWLVVVSMMCGNSMDRSCAIMYCAISYTCSTKYCMAVRN